MFKRLYLFFLIKLKLLHELINKLLDIDVHSHFLCQALSDCAHA